MLPQACICLRAIRGALIRRGPFASTTCCIIPKYRGVNLDRSRASGALGLGEGHRKCSLCLLKGDPTSTPGAVGLPRPQATLPLLFMPLEAAAFLEQAQDTFSLHSSQETEAATHPRGLSLLFPDAPAPILHRPPGRFPRPAR